MLITGSLNVVASTVGFAAGVTLGWNSLAGVALRTAVGWDNIDASDVICIVSAGAAVGSIIIPVILTDIIELPCRFMNGANGALIIATTPLLIAGWILVYLAGYSVRMFCTR
jgi:hypothetical protein